MNALMKVTIRSGLQPGDIGYILYLHGTLYEQEYGWDYTFEGYVAEGMAKFALSYDEAKDNIWIAEADGQIVGAIAIVGVDATTAQLRWFIVHPGQRGHGLGRALLQHALQFCADKRFERVFLWTVSELTTAAHLYTSAGFRPTEQHTHEIWSKRLTEVRYDLELAAMRESWQRMINC